MFSGLAKTDRDKHVTKYIHYHFQPILLPETQVLSQVNVLCCYANYFGKKEQYKIDLDFVSGVLFYSSKYS